MSSQEPKATPRQASAQPVHLAHLLDQAKRLLRKGGPEALTMDTLAAAAGVSRATVYRQVGSREALLERLAADGVEVGDREDVRSRILGAAATVFARAGFEAATVEAIAEAAGVGSATVYRHFGDKRSLTEAYLAASTPRQVVWSIAREPSMDLRADLEHIVRTILERMEAQRDILPLALIERLRGSTLLGDVMHGPHRTIHGVAALLRGYIERGELEAQDPELLARALQGMIVTFGFLGTMLGLPPAPPHEATARLIVGIFLDGARRKTEPSSAVQRSQP